AGRRRRAGALRAHATRRHARPVAGAVPRRRVPGRRGDPVHRRAHARRERFTRERRMTDTIDDRVLALAGMLQALAQVRRIADTGQSDAARVQAALDSVFRIDADDAEAVYGGIGELRGGLRQLRDYLASGHKDEALGKLALAVLQLERRFVRDDAVVGEVQAGIHRLADEAERSGS